MMLKISFLTALAALVGTIQAGQGLNPQACVYVQIPPSQITSAYFKVGGPSNSCMRPESPGHDSTYTFDNAGLKCVSVGYIERKASSSGGDTCATQYSYWGLGYTMGDKSGFTVLKFMSGWATLQDHSAGTVLCTSEHRCSSTAVYFSGNGPLYIIFDPYYAPGKEAVESLESLEIGPELVAQHFKA
ncbi:hypothetical protein ABW20_dc0108329 [Dactylellina cionopaga]|nr:hypothetical protein ABW20_dc0108329 [Dactylellina cionopaga]